eukprot:2783409-Rhodomonas_salina.1
MGLQEDFDAAAADAASGAGNMPKITNDQKLELYALFKQQQFSNIPHKIAHAMQPLWTEAVGSRRPTSATFRGTDLACLTSLARPSMMPGPRSRRLANSVHRAFRGRTSPHTHPFLASLSLLARPSLVPMSSAPHLTALRCAGMSNDDAKKKYIENVNTWKA